MILADISTVEPTHVKDVVIILLSLLTGAGVIVMIVRKPRVSVDPQPLDVRSVDKFATRDFCTMKHAEIKAALDRHENELDALWNTVRAENESIRHELRKGFQDMERSLGRIEGKLSNKTEDL